MKQQRGFTLVELIIVIVILGILAVTAAPRFFDFSNQARASTIEGVKAAIQGGAEIGYAQNALSGSAAYPDETAILGFVNLTFIEADGTTEVGDVEWVSAVESDILYITLASFFDSADEPESTEVQATNCYVSYDPSEEPPVIVTEISGC